MIQSQPFAFAATQIGFIYVFECKIRFHFVIALRPCRENRLLKFSTGSNNRELILVKERHPR